MTKRPRKPKQPYGYTLTETENSQWIIRVKGNVMQVFPSEDSAREYLKQLGLIAK